MGLLNGNIDFNVNALETHKGPPYITFVGFYGGIRSLSNKTNKGCPKWTAFARICIEIKQIRVGNVKDFHPARC